MALSGVETAPQGSFGNNTVAHRWRKVLYTRQPFPDNHVDATFMASLHTSRRSHSNSHATMLVNTTSVLHQACVLATTFDVYGSIARQHITVGRVVLYDVALLASMYGLSVATSRQLKVLEVGKTIMVFMVILLTLSPILRTLTASYSTDTVWALTITLCSLSLITHDFSLPTPASRLRVRGNTSLNASMFASVLVTSRLHSTAEVFAFEMFCVLMFGLVPITRQSVQMYSTRLHITLTVLFFLFTLALLYTSATVLAAVFLVMAGIWLVCPLVFTFIQKYRTEIRGPWDIAQVSEPRVVE